MFILTNCLGSLPSRVKQSIREVLYRLPWRAAMTILDSPYILVIYADSVSTCAYNIQCPPHHQAVKYWLHIVTLTQELEPMPDEVLMAAIAHEFAHVFLKHAVPPLQCEDKGEFMREENKREEEANNLAKKWGFMKEIEALQQWGRSQASGVD
jgi:hypothetical protein